MRAEGKLEEELKRKKSEGQGGEGRNGKLGNEWKTALNIRGRGSHVPTALVPICSCPFWHFVTNGDVS